MTAASGCLNCPANQYQASIGSSTCLACDAGFVQPSVGQTRCIADKDHFKCWAANDTKKAPFTPVTNLKLDDAFAAQMVDITEPMAVCNPADEEGAGIAHPDRKLCCYRIAEDPLESKLKVTTTDDRFGTQSLKIRRPLMLCEPCSIKPADPK